MRDIAGYCRERDVLREIGPQSERLPTLLDCLDADDGRLHLVLSVVPGRPLGDQIGSSEPLGWPLLITLGCCILDAIDECHRLGYSLVDFNSGSVMVNLAGERPTVGLVDFGQSRRLGSKVDFLETNDLTPDHLRHSPAVSAARDAAIAARLLALTIPEVVTPDELRRPETLRRIDALNEIARFPQWEMLASHPDPLALVRAGLLGYAEGIHLMKVTPSSHNEEVAVPSTLVSRSNWRLPISAVACAIVLLLTTLVVGWRFAAPQRDESPIAGSTESPQEILEPASSEVLARQPGDSATSGLSTTVVQNPIGGALEQATASDTRAPVGGQSGAHGPGGTKPSSAQPPRTETDTASTPTAAVPPVVPCANASPDAYPFTTYPDKTVLKEDESPQQFMIYAGAITRIGSSEDINALGLSRNPTSVPRSVASAISIVPRSGTMIHEWSSPTVILIVGGARFEVTSPSIRDSLAASGSPYFNVPNGTFGRLSNRAPREGTLLQAIGDPTVYQVRSGNAVAVTPCSDSRIWIVPLDEMERNGLK